MTTRHTVIHSPLDELTLVADDDALTGVYFRHHWRLPKALTLGPRVEAHTDALFASARRQLLDYLAGDRTEFDLPTAPDGDEDQRRVWALLTHISYGETRTYGHLAAMLGDGITAWQGSDRRSAAIRSASSCHAIASWAATAASPVTRAG
jgi:methylated-DNA-[protein]-cysteine S-methyltransferase